MLSLKRKLPKVARAQRTTLIYGETGTGKELVARQLHALSPRSKRPFIVVHCGAIPENLFEAELFGHERGAFTGADRSRKGLVEEALDGTIFLDEINSLSSRVQSKLLRFLESGEYRSVGSTSLRRSASWVLAASNENLWEQARQKLFRLDLLHRLQALSLSLPPLQARSGDVLLLAEHFKTFCGGSHLRFTPDAKRAMLQHEWPGNVRELRNRIEASVLMVEGDVLDASALGLETPQSSTPDTTLPFGNIEQQLWSMVERDGMSLYQATRTCERLLIEAALRAENENRTRAAARLGIHVRTIFKKLST